MNAKKSIDWAVLGLFVGALLFRLALLKFRFAIGWDEPHYLVLAASFKFGHFENWLHPFWSPLFPTLTGLVAFAITDFELAGRVTNILLGSLILLPLYKLSLDLFDRRSALLTMAVCAFFPPLAFTTTAPLAEPAYMLFAYLGIWLGWRSLARRSLLNSLAAGACFGLSYLARPEGVGFLLVYAGFASLVGLRVLLRGEGAWPLKLVGLAVLGWSALALPYAIYLHGETGQWTLSAKAMAVQQLEAQYFVEGELGALETLSEDNRTFAIDQIYHDGSFVKAATTAEGAPPIKTSPLTLVKKYTTHFYRLVKSEIAGIFSLGLMIPFVLGLFGERWQPATMRLTLYLLSFIVFFCFVVVPLFHINERYLMSLLPLAMIWIGHGIARLKSWAHESLAGFSISILAQTAQRNRVAWLIAGAIVVIFAFVTQLASIAKRTVWLPDFWHDAVELKLAGEWLEKHTDVTPVLMSHNKAVDFYAGIYDIRSGASFSQNEWPRLAQYASYRGVTHVVWTERYAEEFPCLRQLADPATAPPELTPVYDETPAPGLRTIIYRFHVDSAMSNGIESHDASE